MNAEAKTSRNTLPAVRTWLTALRPFAYTASILPVTLGAAIAHGAGFRIRWETLALTLLGVLGFHTAANLLNDVFDYRRGLDTAVTPNSGAIVRGWITERQAKYAAFGCLAMGGCCGLVLAVLAGRMVLLLGGLGAICALGYTTPRFCFKYAGLGDMAVGIAFGILPVFGAWWIQTRTFDWMPILWSLPLTSLAMAILHANNWRDIQADSANACQTVAARLGHDGSRIYYRILIITPFVLTAIYSSLIPILNQNLAAPPLAPIAFAAFPMALRLTTNNAHQNLSQLQTLDAKTARLHLVFGLLCTIAFVSSLHTSPS